MPLPATTQQWSERTPDNFVFNIKAFRLFTGATRRSRASCRRTCRKRSAGPRVAREAGDLRRYTTTSTTAICPRRSRRSSGVGSSSARAAARSRQARRRAFPVRALDHVRRRASPPRRALRARHGRRALSEAGNPPHAGAGCQKNRRAATSDKGARRISQEGRGVVQVEVTGRRCCGVSLLAAALLLFFFGVF